MRDQESIHTYKRLDTIQKKGGSLPPTPAPVDGVVLAPAIDLAPMSTTPSLHDATTPTEPEQTFAPDKKPTTTAQTLGSLALLVAGVFLLSVAPIRLFILKDTLSAKANTNTNRFTQLAHALNEKDFLSAGTQITLINQDLDQIKKEMVTSGQKNIYLNTFLPTQDYSANLENIFSLITDSSHIADSITAQLNYFATLDIAALQNPANKPEIQKNIELLHTSLVTNKPSLDRLVIHSQQINAANLPGEIAGDFARIQRQIVDSQKFFEAAIELTRIAPKALGYFYDQKYLLLFQNNTELRPTGGFIGSYGILTVRDAQIKNIFVDSIYNPDGQLTKTTIPPLPLQKVTQQWAMRDSNWDPDFPSSANQIQKMYELEGGFTPDGMIAIDTYPIVELLRILGPIAIEKHSVVVDADNFVLLTQFKTSIAYDPADNNPKQFLNDLGPLMLEKILKSDSETQKKIIAVIHDAIVSRHIQLQYPDERIAVIMKKNHLDGSLLTQSTTDYFMYVNANIGGMKTNQEIEETVEHEITENNRSYIHAVTINRTHTGIDAWPSGTNFAYMRFYLPKNATITTLSGFQLEADIRKTTRDSILYLAEGATPATVDDLAITHEHGKKVAGAWAVISPGQSKTLTLTYEIPKRSHYNLTIQKQAGVIDQPTTLTVQTQSLKDMQTNPLKQDWIYRPN